MAQAVMGTLDRYILKRSLSAASLILFLAIILAIFFDLVLSLEQFLSARLDAQYNRWSLMAQLYLCRIPIIINGIIPFAVVAGALICLTPMLKKGEWTAVIAGGISPHRIALPLCILALGAGLIQCICNSYINPRLYHPVQAIESAFDNRQHTSRIWHVEDTQTTWYAARCYLPKNDVPYFEQVFIAPKNGGAVFAKNMQWNNNTWVLGGPIYHWHVHGDQQSMQELKSLPLTDSLSLQLEPELLRQELLTREAFNSLELWERGEHMHMTLLLNRLSAIVVPLIAILYALPIFMRFANQHRILVAASQALLIASIPVALIALTGMAADASNWSPWLSNSLGLIIAALPGIYLFRRWSA